MSPPRSWPRSPRSCSPGPRPAVTALPPVPPAPPPAGAGWSAPRASAPRTPGRAEPAPRRTRRGPATGRLRGPFAYVRSAQAGQQGVLDEGDERALGLGAVPGVGGDDGRLGTDLQRLADLFGAVGLVSVEAVEGDDEGQAAVLEVVDGGEAVGQPPGVDEDDGADGAPHEVVPHEPEAVLAGGAEQVEDQVLVQRDAAEVHGDRGGGLVL